MTYFGAVHNNGECTFQYLNDHDLDPLPTYEDNTLNYSIMFKSNHWVYPLSTSSIKVTHCKWLPGSAFNTAIPTTVNRKIIKLVNETLKIDPKSLCYCLHDSNISCYIDQLGFVYPGQTLNVMFAFPNSKARKIIVEQKETTACIVTS